MINYLDSCKPCIRQSIDCFGKEMFSLNPSYGFPEQHNCYNFKMATPMKGTIAEPQVELRKQDELEQAKQEKDELLYLMRKERRLKERALEGKEMFRKEINILQEENETLYQTLIEKDKEILELKEKLINKKLKETGLNENN